MEQQQLSLVGNAFHFNIYQSSAAPLCQALCWAWHTESKHDSLRFDELSIWWQETG